MLWRLDECDYHDKGQDLLAGALSGVNMESPPRPPLGVFISVNETF